MNQPLEWTLQDVVRRAIERRSAAITFHWSGDKDANARDGEGIYRHSNVIAGEIVDALSREYSIVRKGRTERKLYKRGRR